MSDEVTRSSGNVFADLGFEDPEGELAKAHLVREIRAAMLEQGLTQVQAADRMGLKQPDVSAMINGRVGSYSLERLIRCVRALDRDVEIVVRPRLARAGASP
jgi:predicted XRE-type DNA-binding protein